MNTMHPHAGVTRSRAYTPRSNFIMRLIVIMAMLLLMAGIQLVTAHASSASLPTSANAKQPRYTSYGCAVFDPIGSETLKVTWTNGACKYSIPSYEYPGLNTTLGCSTDRIWAPNRYSMLYKWCAVMGTYSDAPQSPFASYAYTNFGTYLDSVQCLNPQGMNVRCGYVNIHLREYDNKKKTGGKFTTGKFSCGRGQSITCSLNSKGNSRFIKGKDWYYGGGFMQSSTGCQLSIAQVTYASFIAGGRYAKFAATRSTNWWNGCKTVDW